MGCLSSTSSNRAALSQTPKHPGKDTRRGEVMRVPESHLETDLKLGPITDHALEGVVPGPGAREQNELEKALNESKTSEARLRKIIDTIPSLAWCNLPDGSNEFLNQRWHDYTGLSLDESGGSGWQTVIHPQDLPRMM